MNKVGLSRGISTAYKIAEFGVVSESSSLSIKVTINRESGAVLTATYLYHTKRKCCGLQLQFNFSLSPMGKNYTEILQILLSLHSFLVMILNKQWVSRFVDWMSVHCAIV